MLNSKAPNPPCANISYAYVEENDAESPSEALLHCQRILERVTALVSWLQSSEIICTHINILRHEPKTGTIQVKHLPLGYIAKLKALINDHLASRGIRSRQLLDASLELLLEQPVEGLSEQILEDSFSAIDGCTMAVQMICVALLSSSQAHLGGIRPFFLDHVLERFELRGVEGPISKHISISLGLMSLTCMGDMLGTQVMAFSSGELVTQGSERYDLGASMDDVFDLWGPGRVIQAEPLPLRFEIGGGCIYQPVGSTKFHWIAGQPDSEPAEVEVISEKITIGALVVINEHCRSQPNPNEHNTVPRQNITREVRALGTQPKGWALQQIQAGFQGGNIITPTMNATWIKRHPRVLRQRALEIVMVDFLEQPWGLLVSVCTGIARRVRLREAIAEVMPSMMAALAERPGEWASLAPGIGNMMRDPDFRRRLEGMTPGERAAVVACAKHIIGNLSWTGVDDGNKLVLAVPSYEQSDGCVQMTLSESRPFAGILKDSVYSTTFVCLTSRCFLVNGYSCRNLDHPRWQNKISALATSMCKYRWRGRHIWDKLSEEVLEEGKVYWVGNLDDKRRVEVCGRLGNATVLKVQYSLTPGWFWLRAWERVERMRSAYVALREMSFVGELGAHEVLIRGN